MIELFARHTYPSWWFWTVSSFGYIPNLGYNVAMIVVFSLLLAFHMGAGVWYKQWWFVISYFFACGLQVVGYAGRVWSHYSPVKASPYLLQIIPLIIAPVFTMAGIYYQLAKLASVYGNDYCRISPMWYSYIFIACDIISLVIQGVGGGLAGSATENHEDTSDGTHVMLAGVAFQVLSMLLFIYLWCEFLWKIGRTATVKPRYAHLAEKKMFKWFPYSVSASIIFVLVRCIYRVVEMAEGWTGDLITHEAYFMVLDGVMMALATFVLAVNHPGFAFDGRHTSIPTGKKAEQVVDKELLSPEMSEVSEHSIA